MPKVKPVSPPRPRWLTFYQQYDVSVEGRPNEDGWEGINCVLPTHPGRDTEKKAGVNLDSGSYLCHKESCRTAYVSQLNKPSESRALTPREFLIIAHNLPPAEAQSVVENYRLARVDTEFKADDQETKHFAYLSTSMGEWMTACQEALDPSLDVVHEYLASRSLKYDTLVDARLGYDDGRLLFPYYERDRLTGIKVRTIDGRKGSIKNSHFGLYNLDSIDESESRTCLITEGETDTLKTKQILKERKINAVILGTSGAHFKHEWERDLTRFTRIIVIPHADDAGDNLVKDLNRVVQSRLEIARLPFPPRSRGKDIVDFCAWCGENLLVEQLALSGIDPKPRPRLMTLTDMFELAQVEPIWIVPGLIEAEQKFLISGNPKTRKTFIAIELMEAVANCTAFMGFADWTPNEPGNVMFVEEEGPRRELAVRVAKIFGQNGTDRVRIIHREGVKFDDPVALSLLRQDVLRFKPKLLIIDPLASIHTGDENDATAMGIVMNAANSLLRALPTMAIGIVHHSGKSGPGARGSSAIWGAVDTEIRVEKRATGTTKIKIEGRSFPDDSYDKMEFIFDYATGRHRPAELITDIGREKLSGQKAMTDQIALFFDDSPDKSFTLAEICTQTEMTENAALKSIKQLLRSGAIVQIETTKKNVPLEYQKAQDDE